MADKIDMSLDDIIKKTKPTRGSRGSGSGRGSGRGGSKRGGAGGRSAATAKSPRGRKPAGRGRGATRGSTRGSGGRPYPRGNPDSASWKHDLYDAPRRGGIATSGGPGKLVVSNLEFGVSDSDIQELFSEFGHLRQAAVHYDRSGRSLGTADVVFDRKADAIKAMKQYNGVPLDGRAMSIQLVGSAAELAGSPRRAAPSAPARTRRGADPRMRRPASGRVEKRRSGAGGAGKPARGSKPARGAKRGGGGAKREKKPAPTADELDKELDSYLKAR